MPGNRPMTKREKEMLREDSRVVPNYKKFNGPVTAPKSSDSQVSDGPVIAGQRRANAIDSIVTEAQKGGSERQSSYPSGR